MGVGLQDLVEGNINTLSEYNEVPSEAKPQRKIALAVNPRSAPSSTIPKKHEELSIIQEHDIQEFAGENTQLLKYDVGMEELTETLDPFEDSNEVGSTSACSIGC